MIHVSEISPQKEHRYYVRWMNQYCSVISPKMYTVSAEAVIFPHLSMPVINGQCDTNLLSRPNILNEAHDLNASTSIQFDEPCIYIGGSTNFGHWIFEGLLKLPFTQGIPLAVHDNMPDSFYDFLEICGSTDIIRVPGEAPFILANGRFVTPPFRRTIDNKPCWYKAAATWLNKALYRNGPRKRIFLKRRAEWRRCLNEDEIIDALNLEGIDPSQFSAEQQCALFSNADLIVATAGSGAALTVAAKCPVLEIAPPGWGAAFGPLGFAACLDQPYMRLAGVTEGENDDYRIDINSLMRCFA